MTDSMKNNDVKESEIKEKKNMGESVKGMAKSIGSKANLVVKKSSKLGSCTLVRSLAGA